MGWLFGSRATTAGTAPAVAAPAPAPHRSLALGALLGALHPDRREQVLDLGPPVGGNIEWLSSRGARVFVADLYPSLTAESVEARAPENFPRLVSTLLPIGPDDVFDAVLAWDLFNYLRPDQIGALMARVAPCCRPGALVLSFVSTRKEIPNAPLRYRILSPETIRVDGPIAPTRAAPRFLQPDLARVLPAFRLKSSFLLRNGTQEYLFARRG